MRINTNLEKTQQNKTEIIGLVFDIQKFTLHDGPGIRTLVFMQGCPLRCKWCSNPEGQKPYPQLSFTNTRCVGANVCGAPCIEACPVGAISLSEEGKPQTDRGLCTGCGCCTRVCIYGARTLLGRAMTVTDVLAEVEKDRMFYRYSGGGMTVGGGEPLIQHKFVLELLRRGHDQHFLHTVLETCGHIPWEHLKQASGYLDLMYYDIKHMNPERHEELTGMSNKLILSNAGRILSGEVSCDVIVRVEVIPDCNDSEDNIEAIAKFVAESSGKMMELLPYHALGSAKFKQLEQEYDLKDIKPPSDDQMKRLINIVTSFGLKEMTGVL